MIRNREKEETMKKRWKTLESHLEENQYSLTIEGCNLAMKENITLFISKSFL